MASFDRAQVLVVLAEARRKGLIDSAERTALLKGFSDDDPEALSGVLDLQDALHQGTLMGRVTNFGAGLWSQVSSFSGRVPTWLVLVILAAFVIGSGGIEMLNVAIPSLDSTTTAQGVQVSSEVTANWIQIGGIPVPISKLPWPVDGVWNVDAITIILAVLLAMPSVIVFVDNLLPRGNQPPNTKGNFGLILWFISFWAWGTWAAVLAVFANVLARRKRGGEQAGVANSFLIFALAMWLWFTQIGPRLAVWFTALDGTFWQWVPDVLAYLANGDNSRPLAFVALIAFTVYGWFTDNDSSTMLAKLGIWLAWALLTGKALGLELVVTSGDVTLVIAKVLIGFALLVVLVELWTSKAAPVAMFVVVILGLGMLVYSGLISALARLGLDERWLAALRPVWVTYALLVWLGHWVQKEIITKSPVFKGIYDLFGNWLGNFIPFGPIQLAVDATIGLNLLVVALYLWLGVKLF